MHNSSSSDLIVALGNTLKGDDAIGIEVGKLLSNKFNVLFAYTSPDAYISKMQKINPKRIPAKFANRTKALKEKEIITTKKRIYLLLGSTHNK